MTSGASSNDNEITYRKATPADLDGIKALVDRHKTELGFVVRGALERSINLAEIIVAAQDSGSLAGFVHYHHRKDGQTTLYNIVVDESCRHHGIGRQLINELTADARQHEQAFILLKCPEQLPANDFYRRYGFTLADRETGKKRPLSIWRLGV